MIPAAEVCSQLYMVLKDDNLYPSFSAELIRLTSASASERMIPQFGKYIHKLFNQEDKIGLSDLKAACGTWLLQNKVLSYSQEELLINEPYWGENIDSFPISIKDLSGPIWRKAF